jgi:hypothetical protein
MVRKHPAIHYARIVATRSQLTRCIKGQHLRLGPALRSAGRRSTKLSEQKNAGCVGQHALQPNWPQAELVHHRCNRQQDPSWTVHAIAKRSVLYCTPPHPPLVCIRTDTSSPLNLWVAQSDEIRIQVAEQCLPVWRCAQHILRHARSTEHPHT